MALRWFFFSLGSVYSSFTGYLLLHEFVTSATLTLFVTVIAGNWFRGLAGDSTAYLPGSSVSISPSSVAFSLHGICLPWLSVLHS